MRLINFFGSRKLKISQTFFFGFFYLIFICNPLSAPLILNLFDQIKKKKPALFKCFTYLYSYTIALTTCCRFKILLYKTLQKLILPFYKKSLEKQEKPPL